MRKNINLITLIILIAQEKSLFNLFLISRKKDTKKTKKERKKKKERNIHIIN